MMQLLRRTPLGLRYMIMSAVCFSVMSMLVKLGGQSMHTMQLVLARCVVALVMSYVSLRRQRLDPWGPPEHRRLLVARGVLGFIGLCCFYYALTHMPLGDVTVIQYTNPALTALIASAWLGERVGRQHALGVLVCLVGVVWVARPPALFGGPWAFEGLALGAACAGALVSSVAYTTVRALSGKAPPMVVVFYFPLVATPAAIALSAPYLSWPTPREWLILLGVGVSTQVAQVFMTQGLHLERAGRAMAVTYMQIVFAFAWGVALFGEVPSWMSVLGAALILVGSAVAVRQRDG